MVDLLVERSKLQKSKPRTIISPCQSVSHPWFNILPWFLALVFFLVGIPRVTAQGLDEPVSNALRFAESQLRRTVTELGDTVRFPRSTLPDGSWSTTEPRQWTSGFFPGCLWYMAEYTRDPFFENSARRWTEGLNQIQYYGGSHDVGFLIFDSYGHGYRLHPSEEYKKVILQTAQTLTTRFNPKTGCIRSWDHGRWGYPVIVDNMMNLELLFWASENGGTKRFREIAISHAEKTMLNHVRPDGSTYHVLDYDTTNGTVLARNTHQGYADESVWARGQAWAIYGFTMTYRFTKDERFLRTAQRVADYYLQHLPADHVPYWDFKAPGIPNEPRDVSAAAIAASGLFELSQNSGEGARQAKYREAAEKTLQSLCSPAYLAEGTNSRGILNHAVGHMPAGTEIDVSIIYADYYFIEAMLRYQKQRN
ncbi:MAG: glycoside hydrolase family 88 protein [Ignavibacteriales bacterium]|nr:glycoside hydrolase family 88 protein [Ignavibacteriales bacterium]